MIKKYEKIFKDNVISYIFNRMQIESSDAVIAQEVMSRFPVWVGFSSVNKEDQRQLIVFLIYGMRQVSRVNNSQEEQDGRVA